MNNTIQEKLQNCDSLQSALEYLVLFSASVLAQGIIMAIEDMGSMDGKVLVSMEPSEIKTLAQWAQGEISPEIHKAAQQLAARTIQHLKAIGAIEE